MKIAILYICTGAYNRFFEGFYESSEKYFLHDEAEKEYFVFTDDLKLSDALNVHLVERKCQGFPADSLFRFEMFLQVKDELKSFDYIYFFNANAEFKHPVNKDILPDETGLSMGLWYSQEKPWWSPWRVFDHPAFFCYERNKESMAYIAPFGKNYKQFMGGLNGGRPAEYIKMIETLAENIRKDYENGIVAIAHDQSHINAYMRTHPCKIIPKEYCWPEEWPSSFEPKVVFRDKKIFGGTFLKGRNYTLLEHVQRITMHLKHAISWYL